MRKREHIAKIDKEGGYWGMEDHIERTVFCHGDVVLVRPWGVGAEGGCLSISLVFLFFSSTPQLDSHRSLSFI